jgi:hypothetical protein
LLKFFQEKKSRSQKNPGAKIFERKKFRAHGPEKCDKQKWVSVVNTLPGPGNFQGKSFQNRIFQENFFVNQKIYRSKIVHAKKSGQIIFQLQKFLAQKI